MKLHEFQARDLLRDYTVQIPQGMVAATEGAAAGAAEKIGLPVVVKAQVLTGGRGKAGGVERVATREAAGAAARRILGLKIAGYAVARVLVVEALDVAREYYLALTADRNAKCLSCVLSAAGGVDIEETAKESPDKILTLPLSAASRGAPPPEVLAGVFGARSTEAARIIAQLHRLFREKDLSLLEINPLVLTKDNRLIAADAKIVLDDNALFKHPELERLRNHEEYTADELAAQQAGLAFISLDGSIGCMVNGAGLAMATMDLIRLMGGHPANFLDVGGSSNPEKVLNAFRILLANPAVRVILVNIFGGITRCDDIARGIIMAKETLKITLPLVIRLTGTNDTIGRKLLEESGMTAMVDMAEAVQQAVVLERMSHEHSH